MSIKTQDAMSSLTVYHVQIPKPYSQWVRKSRHSLRHCEPFHANLISFIILASTYFVSYTKLHGQWQHPRPTSFSAVRWCHPFIKLSLFASTWIFALVPVVFMHYIFYSRNRRDRYWGFLYYVLCYLKRLALHKRTAKWS